MSVRWILRCFLPHHPLLCSNAVPAVSDRTDTTRTRCFTRDPLIRALLFEISPMRRRHTKKNVRLDAHPNVKGSLLFKTLQVVVTAVHQTDTLMKTATLLRHHAEHFLAFDSFCRQHHLNPKMSELSLALCLDSLYAPATTQNSSDARSAAQQHRREPERREREREEREEEEQRACRQLATPPATNRDGPNGQLRRIQPRPHPAPRPIQPRPNPPAQQQQPANTAAQQPQPQPNPAGHHRADLPLARRPYVEPAAIVSAGWSENALIAARFIGSPRKFRVRQLGIPSLGCVVDVLDEPPAELQALLVGTASQTNEFRKNIAQYNTALSFTLLGVKIDNMYNNGGGPYSFHIRGELCHRIGSLLPAEGQNPTYAQLYFHEPQAALDYRMRNNSNLRRNTMQILQHVINANHKYAPLFVQAKEIIENQEIDDICIRLRVTPGVHARRGNLPTADEVAVIIPDQNNTQPRDIILCQHAGLLVRISDIHHAYTPLYYVLLFPYGEDGWHGKMTLHEPDKDKPKRLSQT
ncbi:hypothetical protein C8F01DRAFT_1293979 [Mycena amicta]|nr:hypothetical protein C8F01DRAFT_1293979 [Mycena amicta]